ncbi:hypothetical protein [uncultured Acetatifactor sp.]|jgi:hypothetical protein|uniref:hypothetical protein n=1 Tax=uncultured Acetatifactor sp. TaxID=1671927 RepID=UPI00263859CF|nr:hypothetical protein [uncultured Acetatifactor sp.]
MKIKLTPVLYHMFIFLITLDAAVNVTQFKGAIFEKLHYVCLFFSLICALVIILKKKYGIRQFWVMAISIPVGLYSYYASSYTDLLYTFIAIILIDGIDLDATLKLIFNLRLFVFAIAIGSSLLGMTSTGLIANTSAEKGVLLGYGHANTFAGTAGILLLLYIAINRNQLNYQKLIIIMITTISIYYISKTRIFLLLMLATIAVIWCHLYRKKGKNKFIYFKYVLPAIAIINILLIGMRITHIGWDLVEKIDILFNGRMLLAAMNLRYYPITLLGQFVDIRIISSANRYYALDNGYIYHLVHYGLVGLMLFCAFFQKSMFGCIKHKEFILCLVSTIFMIWMVYEGMMASTATNFALLFAFAKINDREPLNREENYYES